MHDICQLLDAKSHEAESCAAVHKKEWLCRPPPPAVVTRRAGRVCVQKGEESTRIRLNLGKEGVPQAIVINSAPRPACCCMYETNPKPDAATWVTTKATAYVDKLRCRPEALSGGALSLVSRLVAERSPDLPQVSRFDRLGWQGTFPPATQASAPAGEHASWHTLLGWNNARWSRRTT